MEKEFVRPVEANAVPQTLRAAAESVITETRHKPAIHVGEQVTLKGIPCRVKNFGRKFVMLEMLPGIQVTRVPGGK